MSEMKRHLILAKVTNIHEPVPIMAGREFPYYADIKMISVLDDSHPSSTGWGDIVGYQESGQLELGGVYRMQIEQPIDQPNKLLYFLVSAELNTDPPATEETLRAWTWGLIKRAMDAELGWAREGITNEKEDRLYQQELAREEEKLRADFESLIQKMKEPMQ